VIDTKPRFIAEWELNGFTTTQTGRYKRWGLGSDVFTNSYVLPNALRSKNELDRVWALGGQIAIAQAEREDEWTKLVDVATVFYESYGAYIPRLVYVDELADFFKNKNLGEIFMRIARNGRERNCALIACSQRPRKVPTEVITELKRLYMFYLSYQEDVKHIWEFGIPRDVQKPEGFVFYMYDKDLKTEFPSNAYHKLELPSRKGRKKVGTR